MEVAIVTGSNKGIGLAIVRGLCRQFKGDVFLTSRNPQLGKDAVTQLEAEGLTPKYHQLDITSMESIEALKKFMLEEYGGVDVLVNNAGVAYRKNSKASPLEQAIVTLNTNFKGLRNVMSTLTPIIKPHGRIVNVSAYHPGLLSCLSSHDLRDRFSDPAVTEEEVVTLMEKFIEDVRDGSYLLKGWCKSFYTSSKIGETSLAKVYARETEGKEDILINCCNPGSVQTEMSSYTGPMTPDQGAETPIMLALLPPGSPTGGFWKEKALVGW